jgi:hypothetical protein
VLERLLTRVVLCLEASGGVSGDLVADGGAG